MASVFRQARADMHARVRPNCLGRGLPIMTRTVPCRYACESAPLCGTQGRLTFLALTGLVRPSSVRRICISERPSSTHTRRLSGSFPFPMIANTRPSRYLFAATACSLARSRSSEEGEGKGSGWVCQSPTQCHPRVKSISRSLIASATSNRTRDQADQVGLVSVASSTATQFDVRSFEKS